MSSFHTEPKRVKKRYPPDRWQHLAKIMFDIQRVQRRLKRLEFKEVDNGDSEKM
jgi:hypothetical protein